jgi:hypothetical protein
MSQDEIKTQSVSYGVAKTNPIPLDGTSETKIRFHPTLHEKGVSGSIVKFKKDKKSIWENLKQTDFKNHALSTMEKIEIPISTEALKKLVEAVHAREDIVKDGGRYGSHEYITVEKNKIVVIDDKNKKQLLEQILSKGYSDDFWKLLIGTDPELADKLSAGHLQMQRRKVVYELKERLTKRFSETTGNDSWQEWIFRNNWLFGVNYQQPLEKQKINIVGVMPDFLFPTIDDFVDILEIKLPDDEVIIQDSSHNGSWVWSKNSNIAVGQVVNYLSEIDRLRLEIEKQIKIKYGKEVSLLKPRAFILIGNSKSWKPEKKEGLRKLNHSLHGIEVITYNDLIQRGEAFLGSSFIKIPSKKTDTDSISF